MIYTKRQLFATPVRGFPRLCRNVENVVVCIRNVTTVILHWLPAGSKHVFFLFSGGSDCFFGTLSLPLLITRDTGRCRLSTEHI